MFDGHYYYMIGGDTFYQTALAIAANSTFKRRQGHLATVSSQAEFDFLKTAFGNHSFWIAASDASSEDAWAWTAGPESGMIVQPSFWRNGQPSGGASANCAVMNNTGWDDQNCNNDLAAVVVEYELQSATTSSCPRKCLQNISSFKAHSYRVCRAAVPYNGHYYQIAPTRASFVNAIIQASQMSYNGYLGYLAAVSSQDELNFVVKVLGARNVWLASTDIQQEGVWLITAGPNISAPTPVDLWAFGEPFGIGENCAISTT